MKNDYSFHLVAAVVLAGVIAACFTDSAPAQAQPAPAAVITDSASN